MARWCESTKHRAFFPWRKLDCTLNSGCPAQFSAHSAYLSTIVINLPNEFLDGCFPFFSLKIDFIHFILFIFGCVGSSLLHVGFL